MYQTVSVILHNIQSTKNKSDEGPKSAYTVGPQAAHATLDNIRAALNSENFSGVSSEANTVMWGYSGGCLATEWAAEFQASYAPELRIAGAACGGLPVDVAKLYVDWNGGDNVNLMIDSINGITMAYPEMAKYINEHLLPSMAAEFHIPLTACLTSYPPSYSGQNISSYFDNGLGFLGDPKTSAILQTSGTLGNHGTPSIPLLWYKSFQDEILPVADQDALYTKYCSSHSGHKADITYQLNYAGATHAAEAVLGTGAAFAWLEARVSGQIKAPGCSIESVVVSDLGTADIAVLGEETVDLLNYLLLSGL